MRYVQFAMFFSISSTSRCWQYRVDIVSTSVPCHTSFTSTSRCWRYRVDIVLTSVPCHRLPVIPPLTSCRDRYPNIPRLHRQYRDDDDIVSISCQHPYPVIVCLAYLVYIIYIIDIAMLTILCQYRVEIDTLSYLVYIVYIVEIAMFTISYRYLVNNGTLSLFACHTSFTSFTSSTSRCWRYRVDIV